MEEDAFDFFSNPPDSEEEEDIELGEEEEQENEPKTLPESGEEEDNLLTDEFSHMKLRDDLEQKMEEENREREISNIRLDLAEGINIITDEMASTGLFDSSDDDSSDSEGSDNESISASTVSSQNRRNKPKYRSVLNDMDETFRGQGYVSFKSMTMDILNKSEASSGKYPWYMDEINSDEETKEEKSGSGRNTFKKKKKKKAAGQESDEDEDEDAENNNNSDHTSKNPLDNPYLGNVMNVERISTKLQFMEDLRDCSGLMAEYYQKIHEIAVAYNILLVSMPSQSSSEKKLLSEKTKEFFGAFVPPMDEYIFVKEKYKMWRSFYMKNYCGGIGMMENVGGTDIVEFFKSEYADISKRRNAKGEKEVVDKYIGLESDAIHLFMELGKLHCCLIDLEHMINSFRSIQEEQGNTNHGYDAFESPGWCTTVEEILEVTEVTKPSHNHRGMQDNEEEGETGGKSEFDAFSAMMAEDDPLTEKIEKVSWPKDCLDSYRKFANPKHVLCFIPEKAFTNLNVLEIVLSPHKNIMELSASECVQSLIYLAQNVTCLSKIKRNALCYLEFEYLIQMYIYRISSISNRSWGEGILDHSEYRIISVVEESQGKTEKGEHEDNAEPDIRDFYSPSMKWYQFASSVFYVLNCMCNSSKHLLPSSFKKVPAREVDLDVRRKKKTNARRISEETDSSSDTSEESDDEEDDEDDENEADYRYSVGRIYYEGMERQFDQLVINYLREIMYEDVEPAEEFGSSSVRFVEENFLVPGLRTWVVIRESNKPKDYWIEMGDRKKKSIKIMSEAMPASADMLQIYMSRFQYFVTERKSAQLFDEFIKQIMEVDFSDREEFEKKMLRVSGLVFDNYKKQWLKNLWKRKDLLNSKNVLHSYMHVCQTLKMAYLVKAVSRIIQDTTGCKQCVEKYLIKYERLISCDWDLLEELAHGSEPVIIQVDPVNYQVFHAGSLYDCNSDIALAICLWMMIIHRIHENMISPPSSSSRVRTIDISGFIESSMIPLFEDTISEKVKTKLGIVSEFVSKKIGQIGASGAVDPKSTVEQQVPPKTPKAREEEFFDSDEDDEELLKRNKIDFDFYGAGLDMTRNPMTEKGVRSKSGGDEDEEDEDEEGEQMMDEKTRERREKEKKKKEEEDELEKNFVFDVEHMIQSEKFKGSMAERISEMFGMSNKHLSFDGEISEEKNAISSLSRISRNDRGHINSYKKEVEMGIAIQKRLLNGMGAGSSRGIGDYISVMGQEEEEEYNTVNMLRERELNERSTLSMTPLRPDLFGGSESENDQSNNNNNNKKKRTRNMESISDEDEEVDYKTMFKLSRQMDEESSANRKKKPEMTAISQDPKNKRQCTEKEPESRRSSLSSASGSSSSDFLREFGGLSGSGGKNENNGGSSGKRLRTPPSGMEEVDSDSEKPKAPKRQKLTPPKINTSATPPSPLRKPTSHASPSGAEKKQTTKPPTKATLDKRRLFE